ncbi:AMP-binding protein [Salinarimonas soli]|uniref:AMP-binding protein n=1 Tax=Salinarimonas soli TaxID=1638099 RepID=A0A5B2VID9_9HYPH|nr:AMP-binding protein [Salinarimonas soli]KAA2237947.1 AMP-binding protein [Salinarimonas soli]
MAHMPADSGAPLPREALARIVESKLRAEIAAASGQLNPGTTVRRLPSGPWPETLAIADDAPAPTLGSDSLERMWLAGALGEMFDLEDQAGALLHAPAFGDWLDIVARDWRGERVTFLTSGSSGRPKPCEHRMEDLATEVDALADAFAGRTRILTAVPAHHIYGFLFTALLPARLGVPVAAFAAPAPGDLVVSYPDHWAFVARTHRAFASDVAGVTSTAPCPPELKADLAALGLAALTEVYGSSETAGLGLRRHPDPAYTLMPHWSLGPADPEGNPTVVHRSGRVVALMDRLEPVTDRTFTLAGRRDGAVQVGGQNVHPARIAEHLRTHPLVADAAVRLMRPDEGTRLKAFLVLAPGTDEAEAREALTAWIAGAFSAPERPVALTFGAALPVGAMGKAADW